MAPYWSDMMHRVTHVYRLYDVDGLLLYVGLSNQPRQRVRHHMMRQPWGDEIATGTFERFICRADAKQAEWEAIRLEQPQYNITRPAGGSA